MTHCHWVNSSQLLCEPNRLPVWMAAVRIANDTTYGLNASVFTHDVVRRLKAVGIGREGVHEGLPHFLETKFVILEGRPAGYENTEL